MELAKGETMNKEAMKMGAMKPALIALSLIVGSSISSQAQDFTVKLVTIEDKKAVFATVESTDSIAARVRIPGTVSELSVTEGSMVKEGETIALVGDPKLPLRIQAIDAQIRAAQREIDNIKTDKDRAESLYKKGTISKVRRDQILTQFDVASNKLEAAEAERAVIVKQMEEGAVLAPQSGRVLDVPLTVGSVVMPGEAVATIAKENYILRLALPERHAKFLKKGNEVDVAGRGTNCDESCTRTGIIEKVYPRISNGRVLADARVDGLGDYFVGERIQVRVGAGSRQSYLIPADMLFTRYGVDYVRAISEQGDETDIAVQAGHAYKRDGKDMMEILSGLSDGDRLVKP
ncbi:MAG: efflux RND transporter periplasmic adaptor subunit [Cohaesibacter sp.]|jgi:RND family efflux transporter MFP subunit|nr:efflux RND transporter periplasmic adaptor subunit [Cohaesibacter sp.]